jgi:hypothetical protein
MVQFITYVISSGGPWGILVIALAYYLRRREAELATLRTRLEKEHTARLEDARQNTQALLATSQRTHEALEILADIHETRMTSPGTTNPRT